MLCDNVKLVSAGIFSTEKEEWMHPIQNSKHDELIYVTEGMLNICEDFSEYDVKAGNVIFLRGGHTHYGCKSHGGRVSFMRLFFSGWQETEAYTAGVELKKLSEPEDGEKFGLIWQQLMDAVTTPEYPVTVRDYYTRIILFELAINSRDAINGMEIQRSICDYVKTEAPCDVKVSDVAEHFGYSEDYITRIFKKYYAKGLKNYINAVRIGRIKKMLLDMSMSCADIAKAEGFTSSDGFYKFFKARTGMNINVFRSIYTGVGDEKE